MAVVRSNVYGVIRILTPNGYVYLKNTVVNLGAWLKLIANATSIPSSIGNAYISVNGTKYVANVSVNGDNITYSVNFPNNVGPVYSLALYPNPLSLNSDLQIAVKQLGSPIPVVISVDWTLYLSDNSGLTWSTLTPYGIPSANFSVMMYVDDGNANTLKVPNVSDKYLFTILLDGTNNKVQGETGALFTFMSYTTTPSAVSTSVGNGIRLVPPSTNQHTVFYYFSPLYNMNFAFAYTTSSSPPGDGFVICFPSLTPPIALNTSSISGMSNGTVAYGMGDQVCVEFDPASSSPVSVTKWSSNGYVATYQSSSGYGSSAPNMSPNNVYVFNISPAYSSVGITVNYSIYNAYNNKSVAYGSVTVPGNFPQSGYYIVTTRNGSSYYADWTILNLPTWYPYSVYGGYQLQAPIFIPLTALYEGSS